jgi:hypothetical protein
MNPANLANWTVTHVDWSERKWHPRSYTIADVKSLSKLHNIQVNLNFQALLFTNKKVAEFTFAHLLNTGMPEPIKEHVHVTSDGRVC